jgi:hypothetical protein
VRETTEIAANLIVAMVRGFMSFYAFGSEPIRGVFTQLDMRVINRHQTPCLVISAALRTRNAVLGRWIEIGIVSAHHMLDIWTGQSGKRFLGHYMGVVLRDGTFHKGLVTLKFYPHVRENAEGLGKVIYELLSEIPVCSTISSDSGANIVSALSQVGAQHDEPWLSGFLALRCLGHVCNNAAKTMFKLVPGLLGLPRLPSLLAELNFLATCYNSTIMSAWVAMHNREILCWINAQIAEQQAAGSHVVKWVKLPLKMSYANIKSPRWLGVLYSLRDAMHAVPVLMYFMEFGKDDSSVRDVQARLARSFRAVARDASGEESGRDGSIILEQFMQRAGPFYDFLANHLEPIIKDVQRYELGGATYLYTVETRLLESFRGEYPEELSLGLEAFLKYFQEHVSSVPEHRHMTLALHVARPWRDSVPVAGKRAWCQLAPEEDDEARHAFLATMNTILTRAARSIPPRIDNEDALWEEEKTKTRRGGVPPGTREATPARGHGRAVTPVFTQRRIDVAPPTQIVPDNAGDGEADLDQERRNRQAWRTGKWNEIVVTQGTSEAHRFLSDPFDDRGLTAECSELMFRASQEQDFSLYLQAIRNARPWLFFGLSMLWSMPSSTGPLEASFNYAGLYGGKRRWMLSHQALSAELLAHVWPDDFRRELVAELKIFQRPNDWRQHMAATGIIVDRSAYGGLDFNVVEAGLDGVLPAAATPTQEEETRPLIFTDGPVPDDLPPAEDAPIADDLPWLPSGDHLDGQAFEAAVLEDFDITARELDFVAAPELGQGTEPEVAEAADTTEPGADADGDADLSVTPTEYTVGDSPGWNFL